MRYLRMTTLSVALLTLNVACSQTASDATSACSVWRPISWSVKDTLETIDGVKGNNRRQAAFCK